MNGEECTAMQVMVSVVQPPTAADREAFADFILRLESFKRWSRELIRQVEQDAASWLAENGDVQVGDIRYYAGIETHTECNDVPRAIEALLSESGGDVGQFTACLTSQPIKVGAARKVLSDDVFRGLFSTEKRTRLKAGKSQMKMLSANTKYLPSRKPSRKRS